MNVTCTGCHTRFRVADEKVGPKGARLRCSRCKEIFLVPPLAAEASPVEPRPAAAEPPDDPFLTAARTAADDDDDPFARALLADLPSGNFAVAGLGLQVPAPAVASAPPADPFAAVAPANGFAGHGSPGPLDALALEEPVGRAPPALHLLDERPPPALHLLDERPPPALLDFGSVDFGEEAAPAGELAPPPEVEAAPPASAPPPEPAPADAGVDPLAGLSFDDDPGPRAMPPAEAGPATGFAPPVAAEAATPEAAPSAAVPAAARAAAAQEARRGRRRVGPLAVNVLSLAALLAVAAGLLASWRRTADPVAPGAPLTVERVASTLYDSAAGRPVLVVRGEVRSRAGEALPAGRVRVELVDGGRVVARTHAPVGVAPTPEQVFAVDGAAAADRLAEALAAGTPARIEPGAALPFGAVIAEPPAGAASLGVRVTPQPAP